ncbi:MAG: hypothetical protein HRU38_23350 [Saccharospirillaceae bacterium]|nr:hypothetical protein [Saccharospirillaceae bacterium]
MNKALILITSLFISLNVLASDVVTDPLSYSYSASQIEEAQQANKQAIEELKVAKESNEILSNILKTQQEILDVLRDERINIGN